MAADTLFSQDFIVIEIFDRDAADGIPTVNSTAKTCPILLRGKMSGEGAAESLNLVRENDQPDSKMQS